MIWVNQRPARLTHFTSNRLVPLVCRMIPASHEPVHARGNQPGQACILLIAEDDTAVAEYTGLSQRRPHDLALWATYPPDKYQTAIHLRASDKRMLRGIHCSARQPTLLVCHTSCKERFTTWVYQRPIRLPYARA